MSTNLKPHQYEFCLSKMHDDNINVLVALKHTPRNCNNPGSSQPYHTPQACARKLYDRSSGVDHSKSDVSLKIHPSRGHRSAPTTQFVSFCVIVPSPPSLPECVHSTNHPFTPPSALRVPPPHQNTRLKSNRRPDRSPTMVTQRLRTDPNKPSSTVYKMYNRTFRVKLLRAGAGGARGRMSFGS